MSERYLLTLGCSSQQPTRFRNHGAYLVVWDLEGFLFDPGEGTQRQFIYANVPPPVVTRIFISHFHGDHCLGLGSMLMRLNLDKVEHPIHCYYPASGKKNFDALRYGCIYHETIEVIEHPVEKSGLVHDDKKYRIEADFLQHGVDTIGWRISESDEIKFDREKLKKNHIQGPDVRILEQKGSIMNPEGQKILLEDVSWVRKGDVIAVALDTRPCDAVVGLAKDARILLTESTYLEEQADLAKNYRHMTAKEAATLAKRAGAKELILTHFSARYTDMKPFLKEAKEIFPNTKLAEDLKKFPFKKFPK